MLINSIKISLPNSNKYLTLCSVKDLFCLNHESILKCARQINKQHAIDIINTTYLYVHNKKHPTESNEFLKWFNNRMKITYFKPAPRAKNNLFRPSKALENLNDIVDFKQETEEIDLEVFKKSLPLHLQYIYDLYYIYGLSGYEITKKLKEEGYDTHRINVNNWVKEIKTKAKIWIIRMGY